MVTLEDLIEAYYDCRRGKRRTASAVMYELDYGGKLVALRDRINAREYQPGKSICFVVTRPRYREVFAAAFEDRIIHHYIALRLEPMFEQVFSPRTFNCRKGKGQLYGVRTLAEDVRQCSQGYTRDCWVMRMDIQGFFMAIDKAMLADMVDAFILERYEAPDRDDLRYLCRTVVMHRPEEDCERHSPMSKWGYLPANKSLFTCGEGRGLAIGNLFVQLFANFLLNGLDWALLEDFKHVGRYVDDFYIVDTDRRKMLAAVPKIRRLLADLGLTLHPRKFYLQHYGKGVEFTGSIVKPGRVYVCNRTVCSFVRAVLRLNRASTAEETASAASSINSYLGQLRHCSEYKTRHKVLGLIDGSAAKLLRLRRDLTAVNLRRQHTKRAQTLRRIRDGDY